MSMNTKYSPSMYENCMSRLSTVAVSTLTPALNVLSTTLPDSTFLSLVRTMAGPVPGLTCWNSTTDQSWQPSGLSPRPFLRSFVEATVAESPGLTWTTPAHALLQREQLLGRDGEELGSAVRPGAHDERVIDPDAAPSREVDPRFDGDRHASV